jgi:thiamine monophosphate kinase
VRNARIGGPYCLGQCVDDLALDAIGEMAAVGDILETAPAVGDLLVLGERVGDQREGRQVLLERLCKRMKSLLPLRPVMILQQIQRRLDRQVLAIDRERRPSWFRRTAG